MCMNCNHCFKSEKNGYLYCKHPDVIRSRGYSPYCIKEGSQEVSTTSYEIVKIIKEIEEIELKKEMIKLLRTLLEELDD